MLFYLEYYAKLSKIDKTGRTFALVINFKCNGNKSVTWVFQELEAIEFTIGKDIGGVELDILSFQQGLLETAKNSIERVSLGLLLSLRTREGENRGNVQVSRTLSLFRRL